MLNIFKKHAFPPLTHIFVETDPDLSRAPQ